MYFAGSALWLALAPLIALPAVIHLLNRKFPGHLPFSSIALIKKSIAARSRLFRWRHLILALLRTAALLLLLLAFLKPSRALFGGAPLETGARHLLILFDRSLSMEHREAALNGRTRGALEVEKIIRTLGSDDLVDVYAVGRNPAACFGALSADHSEALGFVRAFGPGLGRCDFNKANAAAAKELAAAGGRQEIYYVSDFQRSTWADVDLELAPPSARLFFVNVAQKERANRAILGARQEPGGSAVSVTIGNFAPEPWSGDAELIVDGQRSIKASVSIGPWATQKVTAEAPLGAPGLHTVEIQIPEDNLSQDDHYFLALRAAEQEEILIVTDEAGGKQQSAGFFLSKALNPYDHHQGRLLPASTNSAGLSAARLATTKKVFLTTLDRLTPANGQLLAKFVRDGGSLVYFCDGKSDAESLAILDEAGGEMTPLRLSTKVDSASLASSGQQVIGADFKSRYLRLFRGSQRQSLALMEFYEYYHAQPTSQGTVLMTYADGSPAMACSHPGLGTILLCNFSVNELSSNLARQRAFPAWIQDLVNTLDAEAPPEKPIEVGDVIRADLGQPDLKGNAAVAPDGKPVRTIQEPDGDNYHVSFPADQLGIYRLTAGGDALAFAVNPPADEADLRSMDLDLLPQRLGPKQQAHFAEGSADFESINAGRPLFHFFVFGVLALCLAELLVQFLTRASVRAKAAK